MFLDQHLSLEYPSSFDHKPARVVYWSSELCSRKVSFEASCAYVHTWSNQKAWPWSQVAVLCQVPMGRQSWPSTPVLKAPGLGRNYLDSKSFLGPTKVKNLAASTFLPHLLVSERLEALLSSAILPLSTLVSSRLQTWRSSFEKPFRSRDPQPLILAIGLSI